MYIYVYIHIYIHVYICMYECMYVCICVCGYLPLSSNHQSHGLFWGRTKEVRSDQRVWPD